MDDSRCLFCGEPSTRLCDAMIARAIGDHCKLPGKPAYAVQTMETAHLGTCDAPMCDACRVVVGHICGEEPDTIDRCPKHAQKEGRAPLLAVDKIPEFRRSLHLQWRREQIKSGAYSTPPPHPYQEGESE